MNDFSANFLQLENLIFSAENAETDFATYGLRFTGNAFPVASEVLKSDILTHMKIP